jgi:hypothetical protein
MRIVYSTYAVVVSTVYRACTTYVAEGGGESDGPGVAVGQYRSGHLQLAVERAHVRLDSAAACVRRRRRCGAG